MYIEKLIWTHYYSINQHYPSVKQTIITKLFVVWNVRHNRSAQNDKAYVYIEVEIIASHTHKSTQQKAFF